MSNTGLFLLCPVNWRLALSCWRWCTLTLGVNYFHLCTSLWPSSLGKRDDPSLLTQGIWSVSLPFPHWWLSAMFRPLPRFILAIVVACSSEGVPVPQSQPQLWEWKWVLAVIVATSFPPRHSHSKWEPPRFWVHLQLILPVFKAVQLPLGALGWVC